MKTLAILLAALFLAILSGSGCSPNATVGRSDTSPKPRKDSTEQTIYKPSGPQDDSFGGSGHGGSTEPATQRTEPATQRDTRPTEPAIKPDTRPTVLDKPPPGVKRISLGDHIWFETQGEQRRVLVETRVCRPEYALEFLLTRPNKAYESLLVTEAHASNIHRALVAAKAEPGTTTKFEADGVKPATGTVIRISLEYRDKGKLVKVPAQSWVRNAQTKKEDNLLEWVFAGSHFAPDPNDTTQERYSADDDGHYIDVLNSPTAMIDLTRKTPRGLENRLFEPFAERIPPEDTAVTVILEPVVEKKKGDTAKEKKGTEK